MARYDAKIRTQSGLKTLSISTRNRADAIRIASNHGSVMRVTRVAKFDLERGMKPRDRIQFLRTLSMMMDTDEDQIESIRLIGNTFGGDIRRACRNLLEHTKFGMELPTAMELDRKHFPQMTTALIKAGWFSGNGPSTLAIAADYEDKIRTVSKSAKWRMVASIAVFVIALALAVATYRLLGPLTMESPLFRNNPAAQVPGWMLFAQIVEMISLATGGFLLLCVILNATCRSLNPSGFDRVILRVPVMRDVLLAKNNQITFFRLSFLSKSGVHLERALEVSEQSTPAGATQDDLRRARAALQAGQSWTDQMTSLLPTDRAALRHSPDTSDLAKSMERISEYYSEVYADRVALFSYTVAIFAVVFLCFSAISAFGLGVVPTFALMSAGTVAY